MKRSLISICQCDKVNTSSAMDQSYSDNRADTIVMSIGPLDILPCSVRRSDDFGILCGTLLLQEKEKLFQSNLICSW